MANPVTAFRGQVITGTGVPSGAPHLVKKMDLSVSSECEVNGNPNQFVGVSLSGGGSRAAIFAASILENLEKQVDKYEKLNKSLPTDLFDLVKKGLTPRYPVDRDKMY